jgi:hypothetical protein
VLEVRYEWNFCSWAVLSKPAATGIPHSPQSYLEPNRNSLQKPVGSLHQTKHKFTAICSIYKGAIDKNHNKQQQTAKDTTTKSYRKRKQKITAGCWLVGLGDNLRGRRESVLKSVFSKPFHPTRFSVSVLSLLLAYRALKASNHLLYNDSMSNETLGFRASRICRKSPIVINLGLASLSIALPDSKNSPINFNCAD